MTSAGALTQPALDEPRAVSVRRILGGWQGLGLAVVLTELVLLYGPTLLWLVDRWTMSVWHNAHGLLIPFIVGYFVRQKLREQTALERSSSAWGFAIVVPALVLLVLDMGMHTELLSALSLVLILPGLSLLLIGAPRTKAILFPLSFMAFALPIPLSFTEQIHWQLRQIATTTTATVVPMLGIPLFVEGTTLYMPHGAVQVGDACSGFSTLYAAVAVACLTAYSVPSTGRRLLVLLSAFPLAIAANVLRVILLVLLVVWRGNGILETSLHPLSGMMTFALALPIIFWLGGDVGRRPATP